METQFTSRLDPPPKARNVFAFHRPETLVEWAKQGNTATPSGKVQEFSDDLSAPLGTLNARLSRMPFAHPLITTHLWPAQNEAIQNLEQSLVKHRPRALIQMATGSGKTFTAVNFVYRLIKYAGARRVLFLVDRGNLGDQTLKEFQQFVSPVNQYKFTEEYIVQHLSGPTLDKTARVTISTIQRLYSMLLGKEIDP